MTTPRQPNPVGDHSDVTADDLLVGELTAALFATQRDAADVLPPELAARITRTGEALVRSARVGAPDMVSSTHPSAVPIASRRPLAWAGWLVAAALAGVMVTRERAKPTAIDPTAIAPSVATTGGIEARLASDRGPDVRALEAALLADSSVVRVPWTPTTDSTGRTVSGEVLWSPTRQQGVMRITGLVPNDTTAWQYQLWIFDKTRDARYPVDGGVFDIHAGQVEWIVPIRARIPVGQAVMFAVTVEKPGGVVVSTRERIAMLAKL